MNWPFQSPKVRLLPPDYMFNSYQNVADTRAEWNLYFGDMKVLLRWDINKPDEITQLDMFIEPDGRLACELAKGARLIFSPDVQNVWDGWYKPLLDKKIEDMLSEETGKDTSDKGIPSSDG